MLDTLRADHLGYMGYERPTSPALDKFASESLRFRYAITSAPWTPPAVASMFTGLYSASHGMMPPSGRELAKKTSSILSENHNTMAEIFSSAGYHTIGITPNPWLKPEFQFNQGFKDFVFELDARADVINKIGLAHLDSRPANQPFFLYLHYLDPHRPYTPPAPYDTMFTGPLQNAKFSYKKGVLKALNLYDGEIRFLDDQLGQLFSELRSRGLWENTVIVIISDHGEQFLERGEMGHGNQLFNEEVHVALLLKVPGIPAADVEEVVSPVDILPTLVSISGIDGQNTIKQGVSLIDNEKLKSRIGVLSEIRRDHSQKAITRNDRVRLIMDYPPSSEQDIKPTPKLLGVYDYKADPRERTQLQAPEIVSELRRQFVELNQSIKLAESGTKETSLPDETLKQLGTLGYMK